ncbi:MAG: SDR family oxidoreductase [Planctomycetota bacterium]
MAKRILITGAATGLGRGTAIGLAKAGHKVIAGVEVWPQVTTLKQDAEAAGVELEVLKIDLTETEDHEAALRYDIDILVNNAATGETGPIAEVPVDRVRRVFDVNVFGTLAFTQPFVRKFVERGGGKVVFVSSIVGFSTFPFLAPYCASKHALEAIVQLMREELEGTGVQICTINPGPFSTGFNHRMYDTLDQWYDPQRNFTDKGPIRAIQEEFEGDDLEYDPQLMIDRMTEVIPMEHHAFRTVCPEEVIQGCKDYQAKLWELTV